MATKTKFSNFAEYLAFQPAEARIELKQLYQLIKKNAPGAEEVISYNMPAFKFHGMLVWVANHTNHYGLYPFAKTIQFFKDKLAPYQVSKGTIQFQHGKPIPKKLVTEIIRYRVKENLERVQLKEMARKRKGKQKNNIQ